MNIVDEEQFGPVLPIIKYSDVEDVIARANATENGLEGSIWSEDLQRAAQLAVRKQSGIGVEFGVVLNLALRLVEC